MSSIPQRIAFNIVGSSAFKILNTIIALVGMGFIMRYLGPEKYGWYVTVLAFFSLFTSFGEWGLQQTTTREISQPDADEKSTLANMAGLRIVITIAVLVIALITVPLLPLLAGIIPIQNYPPEVKNAISFAFFAFVLFSFYHPLIGVFQKRLVMNKVVFFEFLSKVVQVGFIIVAILLDLGFYFIASSLIVNMFCNFIFIFSFSRKFVKFKPRFNSKRMKQLFSQATPVGISGIVTFIYFKGDTILLSFLQPASEVGIYGAAYKILENLNFFPGLVVGLLMPLLTYNLTRDKRMFQLLINKGAKFFLILIIPLVIGTLFLADEVITLISGPGFEQSATVLRIIIFALSFIFFGNLFTSILIAARLQKKLLMALVVCAMFSVTANLIFIPKFSYMANSFISVATEFLVVLLCGILIYRNIKIIPVPDGVHWILISGLAMGLFLWIFAFLPFFVLLFTSPAVYFACLFVLGGISKKEVMLLLNKQR